MKINSQTVSTAASQLGRSQEKADGKVDGSKSEKASLQGSVEVGISERAQQFSKAKEIAGDVNSVNEDKVAHFQKLIDEGKYDVSADSIADKLVDEHLLMG